MKKFFTTLLFLTLTCVLSTPYTTYARRSYSSRSGSSSRSFGSSSRSKSSFFNKSKPTTSPSVRPKQSTKSGRMNSVRNQTKHKVQTQNKQRVQTQSKTGTSATTAKRKTQTSKSQKKVVVKKYYYNGKPTYLYYNQDHYYDPWSFSPTWWLLHWAELEQQRAIINDARYLAMKSQVEALRVQGVVPDPSHVENVAPIPDSSIKSAPRHGMFFYIVLLVVICCLIVFLIEIYNLLTED